MSGKGKGAWLADWFSYGKCGARDLPAPYRCRWSWQEGERREGEGRERAHDTLLVDDIDDDNIRVSVGSAGGTEVRDFTQHLKKQLAQWNDRDD
jgi:hypothetical protein